MYNYYTEQGLTSAYGLHHSYKLCSKIPNKVIFALKINPLKHCVHNVR